MLIPVILSGGKGTRLWPVSREARPKPFIKLNGEHSLLQATYQRAAAIPGVEEIMTVTNEDYYFQTQEEIDTIKANLKIKKWSFLLEPLSKNTAPAIALGALWAREHHGNEANLLILPADHLITPQTTFNACVNHATTLAKQDQLVTFGIPPHKPETGYGYIECGSPLEATGFKVSSFHEKPSLEEATHFLNAGHFYWNSGMFCFNAVTFCDTFQKENNEIYSKIQALWDNLNTKNTAINIPLEAFTSLPNISIDYALMEKAHNIAMVPANFDWSDVGCWDSMSQMLDLTDQQGNRASGNVTLIDTTETTIHNENPNGRMIAAIGLKNMIIVDTPDALLIGHRDNMQEVKQVVTKLKETDHPCYKLHQTVYRPWGSYTVLEESPQYKLKRIVVKPGAALSLQIHQHRSEHWVVIQGTAEVVNGESTLILKEQESTFIPAKNQHRLSNPGTTELILIEVQTGSYLGEDDIVRLEDIYGRTKQATS